MNLTRQDKDLKNLYLLKSMGYKYISEVPIVNQLLLPNELEKLNDIVLNCNLCSISNTCKERVFDFGNKNTLVFLLSKSFTNDNILNFFLDIVSTSLNINKDDIYIISILKCKSNIEINNYKKEMNICKDYSLKQLDILKPKMIVSLGDSYKYLLSKEYFKNINKGDKLYYMTSELYILDHPEYIIRNPSLKDSFIESFRKIKNKLESN